MREKEIFFNLLKNIGDYDKLFHFYGSFGDVYIQAACVKEILNENQKVVVICEKRYINLIKNSLKKNITNYIEADGNFINKILNEEKIIGKSKFFPIRMLPTLYPLVSECIASQKLQYIDFLRVLLDSKVNNNLEKIEDENSISHAYQYLENNKIKMGNTIIISADNNTQLELCDDFWLQFIKIAQNYNYDICINASGTINKAAVKLMNTQYKKLEIPPEIVVSLTELAGLYASGNNGYATIQSVFNEKKGFHFIKKPNENGFLSDKFSNFIPINQYFHSNSFKYQFLNNQIEIIVDDGETEENYLKIDKIFKDFKIRY